VAGFESADGVLVGGLLFELGEAAFFALVDVGGVLAELVEDGADGFGLGCRQCGWSVAW